MAADDGHVFEHSGPTHLPAIDWTNEPHQRSIAASLVQACYILEHDRRNNRQGSEALAPPWWMFFHFQLISKILDKDESTIFGAIFEYNPPSEGCKHIKEHDTPTPKYVIAFRGTIFSGSRDIILIVKTIINRLQTTTRTAIALKKVHDFVATHESANIWIAGHSLGSSIGMYVGKHMAKDNGVLLETYLFNPPFISPPLECIKSTRVKHLIYVGGSLMREAIDKVAKGFLKHSHQTDESFERLCAWVPSLFVHAADPVCSGYISYFEEREKTIGGSISMKVSGLALFFNVVYSEVAMDLNDPEPLHLLPSASVTINRSHTHSLPRSHELDQWWDSLLRSLELDQWWCSKQRSHELDQWWKEDLALQSTGYKFDSESGATIVSQSLATIHN